LHPTDDNNFFTFYAVSSHTLVEVYQIGQQGRRKHQKVGEGAVSRGTSRMKMAPTKFPRRCWRGGDKCNHKSKIIEAKMQSEQHFSFSTVKRALLKTWGALAFGRLEYKRVLLDLKILKPTCGT
jgi:hypothetical protein